MTTTKQEQDARTERHDADRLNADQWEDVALDERRHHAQQRKRAEDREATILENLQNPQRCTATYLRIAGYSRGLTNAEFRLLHTMVTVFGNRLENCFPGRRALLHAYRGGARTLAPLAKLLASLVDKGWIERVSLTSDSSLSATM